MPQTRNAYPLLGLLNLRSWSTYELAQQVQRSLHWFWPTAERRLYDEPKLLVELGLAEATEEFTGRRARREYRITRAGRRALRLWINEPSAPRTCEFEALAKVFFADAGSIHQLESVIDGIAAESIDRIKQLGEMLEAEAPFPKRAHVSVLAMQLQLEQEEGVLHWSQWARTQIKQWRSTKDPGDWPTEALRAELAARAHPRAPGE
ncbi:PadR family transcriptional regulator [Leekyejoonella antrihumi]|uniref:PadR family transcriptional regulator n=1 Tax=Leekyejoonella antrihumi TaxID=1660198 RepID=UPI0016482DCA|nr:helix-turn-helix transcriptional regulator [Leekyejoonella antrihumi]